MTEVGTQKRPKIIAIVGPTASGKTALGICLAQKIGSLPAGRRGEIISADSRQVYRGLDIGTGKVTKQEMVGVPHHLLDVCSPKRQFSASDFVRLGRTAIDEILARGNVPVIVGGTGLYVDALLGRVVLPDVPPNEPLRAKLEKKTAEELFAMLAQKDPERAATIEPDHKRRLIRALEIAEALGKNPPKQASEPYDVLWIGISPAEKTLKQRIHDRLLARINGEQSSTTASTPRSSKNMITEARRLHSPSPKGIGLSYKRMRELGLEYRYLADYLQGTLSKAEMTEQLERAINEYARRQLRWFRRNTSIHWLAHSPQSAASLAEAARLARIFLAYYLL